MKSMNSMPPVLPPDLPDVFWPLRVPVPVGGATPLPVWFWWHSQFLTVKDFA